MLANTQFIENVSETGSQQLHCIFFCIVVFSTFVLASNVIGDAILPSDQGIDDLFMTDENTWLRFSPQQSVYSVQFTYTVHLHSATAEVSNSPPPPP